MGLRLFSSRISIFFCIFLMGAADLRGLAPAASSTSAWVETPVLHGDRRGKMPPGSFFVNATYSWIDHPLVESGADGATREVVRSIHSLDLRPGIRIAPRLEASARFSLNSVQMQGRDSGFTFGDSSFGAKYRLSAPEAPMHFALLPEVLLPTGKQELHVSSGGFGWSIAGAFEKGVFGLFRMILNLGYRSLPSAEWRGLDYRRQVIAGVAAEVPLGKRWVLNAESAGSISLPYRKKNSPGEQFVGVHYEASPLVMLAAGIGRSGGLNSSGNPGYRGVMALKLSSKHPEPPERGPICREKPFAVTYFSRALSAQESEAVESLLPYRSDVEVRSRGAMTRMRTLKFGDMTGMSPAGLPYVDNAQIPLAIDLVSLPPRKDVIRIDRAQLKFQVKKVSTDPYLGTELLCFIEKRFCSGGVITQKNWASAVRWEYFSDDRKTANSHFSGQYLGHPVGEWDGKRLYSADLSLDLETLLEGSGVTLVDLLYSKELASSIGALPPAMWPLYLVVADDTFISSDFRLDLVMSIEECS